MATNSESQWLFYAVASGACASLNGVFAKLTTTQLTSSWAFRIAAMFGVTDDNVYVDVLIRVFFFLMNLTFNAIMWGLFTRALTLASSTLRVSVINTSANFVLTALLGVVVFGEILPGLWWVGAAMLMTGSVMIGRRDEETDTGAVVDAGSDPKSTAESQKQSLAKPVRSLSTIKTQQS